MNQYPIGTINNPKKSLILVFRAKEDRWKDVTGEISQIEEFLFYNKHPGYNIRFGNSNKSYTYKKISVRIYQNPDVIDITDRVIFADGELLIFVLMILKFGQYYRIFLTEKKTLVSEKVVLKRKATNAEPNIFRYYHDLAYFAAQIAQKVQESDQESDQEIGQEIGQDFDQNIGQDIGQNIGQNSDMQFSIESFVFRQYQNLASTGRINSATALYAYINGTSQRFAFNQEPIFPFSFNLSQKQAVKQALSNQVSIIEGPPGCGKTQTILNLLMNLVIRGKTAAVVSNNNMAIKNISEKLDAEGIGFISAMLGNKRNKTEFFDVLNNEDLDEFLGSYAPQRMENSEDYSFDLNSKILDELHLKENLKAEKTVELGKIIKEQEHFLIKFQGQYAEDKFKFIPKLNSKACIGLKSRLERTQSLGVIKKFIQELILRFRYGIRRKMVRENLNEVLLSIDSQYYKAKIEEIQSKIADLSGYLAQNNFAAIKAQYEVESKKLLNKHLYTTYQNHQKKIVLYDPKRSVFTRNEFNIDNYKRYFPEFIRRYPIILSTSFSLLTSIDKSYLFDYLIVDEASQSGLISSVLAMSCAKNLVVVGDSKQLEQIDNTEIYNASEKLAKNYKIEGRYVYKENSLLGAVLQIFSDVPVTLLKEHYRCHPKIINFSNAKYYENKLVVMTQDREENPISILKLVKGNHARRNPTGTGQYNLREIDEVENYIKNFSAREIGIISPFRVQVGKYQRRFKGDERIEIDTVHKFQGRQKEAIILSTVVNDIKKNELNNNFINFIDNPKLFNVAVSRAKTFLTLVITHGLYNSKNNNFSDFIKYAEYNLSKSQILKGKVTSVFDMLYSDYTEELYNFLKRQEKKSKDVISEIILYNLLSKILRNYTGLKFAMHVSLNDIIADYSGFSQEELTYLKNNFTHVDFLIYNSITKETIMVIEVDGVKYHEQNIKQSLRDSVKNKAFEHNQIRLLRLKTNESNEENRIRNEIERIMH